MFSLGNFIVDGLAQNYIEKHLQTNIHLINLFFKLVDHKLIRSKVYNLANH